MDDAFAAAMAGTTMPSLPQPDNIQQHDNDPRNVSFESIEVPDDDEPTAPAAATAATAAAPAAATAPTTVSVSKFNLPDFNIPTADFVKQDAELSEGGKLTKSAGFDPTQVKMTPSNSKLSKDRPIFAAYNFSFLLNDGKTRAYFQFTTEGTNKTLRDAIAFAYKHKVAEFGKLNLGVLVSKEAKDLANTMQYPTDKCAVVIDAHSYPRILHLHTGQMAKGHYEFCTLTGIDYSTLLSRDIVDGQLKAGLLGLPFSGPNACSVATFAMTGRTTLRIQVNPIGENSRGLFSGKRNNLVKVQHFEY